MPLQHIVLKKEYFQKAGINEILAAVENKNKQYIQYCTLFLKKEREAENNGDKEKVNVFAILSCITSLHLRSDNITDPLASHIKLEDFTDNHLSIFDEIINDINDPELRARIADVLWVVKRNYKAAMIAIDAYLESAKVLEDPKNWTPCKERIERAARLAMFLSKKNHSFMKVITHIKEVLDRCDGNDPLFLSAKMMELLLELDFKETPDKYSALSQKLAKNAESNSKWRVARKYWEIKSIWDNFIDASEKKEALRLLAETYVKEADQNLSLDSIQKYFVSSHNIQQAIEALRRIGGYNERCKELHKLLLEYQQESMREFAKLGGESIEMDLYDEDIYNMVKNKVKGKNLYDAILNLVLMFSFPEVDKLRQQAEENSKKFFFHRLSSPVIINQYGQVTGRTPSMTSGKPQEVEEAILNKMFQDAQIQRERDVRTYAEPIRQIINQEHRIRIDDFFPIVSNNPFIPPGREYIYAQGLYSGMIGDFLTSTHLLIPQIENSVRYLLQQHGYITSGIDQGIQDERSLNTTLKPELKEKLEEILGKDIVFDLRGLLVERFGQNLRNRMAHGLMDSNMFYTSEAVYLWWMALRLCFTPIIIKEQEKEQEIISSYFNGLTHTSGSEDLFHCSYNEY